MLFIAVIGLLFAIIEIVQEKTESVAPKGTRFDWDEYHDDIRNGMTTEQQIKKRQRGGYMTTARPNKNTFDNTRYEHDKALYGEAVAEMWRKNGSYCL